MHPHVPTIGRRLNRRALFPVLATALLVFAAACGEDGASPVSPATPAGLSLSLSSLQQSGLPSSIVSGLAANRCLAVGPTGTPTLSEITTCSGGADQKFTWKSDGSIVASTGACLTVEGPGADANPIGLERCAGTAGQRWTASAANEIRGLLGKCIGVRSNDPTPGTMLVLWPCNGTPSQKWDAGTASTLTTTSTAALSVTNLTVASGKTYRVVNQGAVAGQAAYIDRTYKLTTPPSVIQGATYIETANDDKFASLNSTSFLSFTVNENVDVYVGYPTTAVLVRPTWLTSAFVNTGVTANTDRDGITYLLFKKSFAAGRVTLGSNTVKATDGSMYVVFIVPKGTTAAPTTSVPAISFTSPKASAVLSGTVTLTAAPTTTSGVAGVTFAVDGKAIGTEDTSSPYSVSWSTSGVANGTHTLSATDLTTAGKSSTTSITISVQNSSTSTVHKGWYVSPSGVSGAAGSASAPWSLATALAGGNGHVQPGDTIWLRQGTYRGTFTATLSGSATAPIVVRAYPGERATIDGELLVNGSNTWYWGFEVANSNPASQGTPGIDTFCPGCRFINLVVHDHSSNGLESGTTAPNQEIYGSLFYNNGFYGQSVDHAAHGIYVQNRTGTARIVDNLLFDQFGYGIHVYGSETAALNNFTIDGNTVVNSGIGDQTGMSGGMDYQIGGLTPLGNLVFTHNNSYRSVGNRGNTARLGYSWGPDNSGGVITDNYFVGRILVSHWSSLTFQNNALLGGDAPDAIILELSGATMPAGSWTGNHYASTLAQPFVYTDASGGHGFTLSGWQQATHLDAGSSASSALPTATRVVVQPNQYEAGRANVVIYNWAHQGAVSVDLSGVLRVGDHFEVRNAQNFYAAPVLTGTYAGGPISLPITSTTPAPTISSRGKAVATGTDFNAYVVVKQ